MADIYLRMSSRVISSVPAGVAIPRYVDSHNGDALPLRPKLRRGISLKDSYRRKLLALPPQLRQKATKCVRLNRVSKGLKAEMRKYRKLTAHFLAQPENFWCICCTLRRERLGENILRNQSVEIHHWAGRIGRLLCYVPYFRAFCNACRTWPHEHPSLARELNLLAPARLWNVFPSESRIPEPASRIART